MRDRPTNRMVFRPYELSDREAVEEIFRRQGLKVDLPLPGEDPAVAFALVGEEDGAVRVALIARATLELHFVAAPDESNQTYKLRRLNDIAAGMALSLGEQLARLKFPVYRDVTAFVPKTMPDMIKLLREQLRFEQESDEFQLLYKWIGS
jgi:hypothetical protein